MILVSSSGSEKMTSAHVDKLVACDSISEFNECGWYNILGMKGDRRVVLCHTGSRDEAIGLIEGRGYEFNGHRLRKLSDDEIRKRRETRFGDYLRSKGQWP